MSTTSSATTKLTHAESETSVAVKAAIVILSDPHSGSDEALGRVLNALAAAYDYKARDEEVTILFQGAGTRWIGVLQKSDHPAHGLFNEVNDKIAGVSCGCADVFGGREEAQKSGFELITDNQVPNTSGLPSLHQLVSQGYAVLTF